MILAENNQAAKLVSKNSAVSVLDFHKSSHFALKVDRNVLKISSWLWLLATDLR